MELLFVLAIGTFAIVAAAYFGLYVICLGIDIINAILGEK